jgi:hypothetical protein
MSNITITPTSDDWSVALIFIKTVHRTVDITVIKKPTPNTYIVVWKATLISTVTS